MSKTAEEILSVLPKFFVEMLPGNMETCVLSEQALQAMQTYAEQQAQGEYDRGVKEGYEGAKTFNETIEIYEAQVKDRVKELDETLAKYKDLIQNTGQQSVEFTEWIGKHCIRQSENDTWLCTHYKYLGRYTTSQLLKIWKDETGNNKG